MLTREHARLAVADSRIYPILAQWCRGDVWHRNCFLDEHYFQVLLQIEDPQGLSPRTLTWSKWKPGGDSHPATYTKADILSALAAAKSMACQLHGGDLGRQGSAAMFTHTSWGKTEEAPCFLFIRKAHPSVLDILLDDLPWKE